MYLQKFWLEFGKKVCLITMFKIVCFEGLFQLFIPLTPTLLNFLNGLVQLPFQDCSLSILGISG
jgi:hypothetical protein